MRASGYVRVFGVLALLLSVGERLRAMEHVTLKNGFELDCERREVVGERVRLYLRTEESGYLEVAADAIARVERMADPVTAAVAKPVRSLPTKAAMGEMLEHAGAAHRVDADLLASVMRAESGGRVSAVSRAGALGLMQLMPGTAIAMGVKDAFEAEQNIDGGSAYLDALLRRYHDNISLALAAYNAGPGAVDRYHGVPPYAETRAYVARVIREFNRRKLAER